MVVNKSGETQEMRGKNKKSLSDKEAQNLALN